MKRLFLVSIILLTIMGCATLTPEDHNRFEKEYERQIRPEPPFPVTP